MTDNPPSREDEIEDTARTYADLFIDWTDTVVSKDITAENSSYELETYRMGAGPVFELSQRLNERLENEQIDSEYAEDLWEQTLTYVNQRCANQGSREEFIMFYDFGDYGYNGNPVLRRFEDTENPAYDAGLEVQDLPLDHPRKEFTYYGGETFYFGEPKEKPELFINVTSAAFSEELENHFSDVIASDWPIGFFR